MEVAGRFWSTARRNALAEHLGLRVIRNMGNRHFELPELKKLVLQSSSAYRQGSCEGIYLRQEDADWLLARSKLVHPHFVQGMGKHWRSHTLRRNRLWLSGKAVSALLPASTFPISRSLFLVGQAGHGAARFIESAFLPGFTGCLRRCQPACSSPPCARQCQKSPAAGSPPADHQPPPNRSRRRGSSGRGA